MLSVANVRSAGGAANYFAADNYYTRSDADRSGEWFGKGAAKLGLEGLIESRAFEAILKGELPNGERVGSENRPHRAGVDLTFSLPKSWSLIALVGGDHRILDAYRTAVKETLAWAEKNAAETRMEVKGRERVVATGNLVIGLFQHDTNRNQEPNAHIHAVVANLTQGPDGKWRAVRNDKLWGLNTLLNSMTMARFREGVEKLGYEVGAQLKHGNFEAAGVPREAIMAFSTRRREILEAVRAMTHQTPQAFDAATLMTRAAKAVVEDRDALAQGWRETGQAIGFDFSSITARANARAASSIGGVSLLSDVVAKLSERGRAWLADFAKRLGARPGDPLVPARVHLKERSEIAAAQAVASAIRHFSEREAAFAVTDIYKAALDFGLPTTIAPVEKRVDQLVEAGLIVRGHGADKDLVTTADAIALEQRIIGAVDAGRGQVQPILTPAQAGERLQALAELKYGLRLNAGQEAAGRLLIGSANRIIAIQGIAGAGKSTLLRPAADALREEGHTVLGLAVQNTLVQMLERDTGINSMTVARFLKTHSPLLGDTVDAVRLIEARASLKGAILLLDEASMVGNADKEKLVRLANLLEVDRFAAIGDRKQLGAVDAGKPFAIMQAAGVDTAIMNLNVRARDKTLRAAQYAAQGGNVSEAMSVLKDHIVEVAEGGAITAATTWLALSPGERDATSIYASGRTLRAAVNEAVQTGLKANGELGQPSLSVDTLVRVSTTREELRYAGTYALGLVIEFDRHQRTQGLHAGRHTVVASDVQKGLVRLRDRHGRLEDFRPGRLKPKGDHDPLKLFERRSVTLHPGDRIRWTDTDHKRGLFNADQARITTIDAKTVAIRTSTGIAHVLKHGDPMLSRLDLAYALNAHMAQGLTSDRGIAVMDSRERNLSNQQTFLVTITRLRDGLTLIVDNAARLETAVERNSGMKTSALEVTRALATAAAKGLAKGKAGSTPVRETPELGKTMVKPYEIGI